jgi:hypothetical protein
MDEGATPEVGEESEFPTQAESLFDPPADSGEGSAPQASAPEASAPEARAEAVAESPPRPAARARATRAGSPPGATAAARQVASIVGAAEQSAERMRVQAEERVRSRIAEGERAAQNRITAAEEEATDIVKWAQEEAARLREAGRVDAEQAVADATGEALTIVARAQETADRLRAEAEQAKTAATGEALTIVAKAQETAETAVKTGTADAVKKSEETEARAGDLLRDARTVASDVRTEGMEVVGNLRELGDSLRSNAERLLRDVQGVHSHLMAQIERADAKSGISRPAPGSSSRPAGSDAPRLSVSPRGNRDRDVPPPPADGEVLDVPEFIPPR